MGRSTLLWVHAPAHDRCMHLLLIEDRPGIAANSAEALERAGHHVHRCHESAPSDGNARNSAVGPGPKPARVAYTALSPKRMPCDAPVKKIPTIPVGAVR